MRFARESLPFVLPFVALGGALLWLGLWPWGLAAAGVAFLVLLFFRDPARSFDGDPDVVVAPADGRVTRVDTVEDPGVGPHRYHRVVTFLSVFDVHVQRCPAAGRVLARQHRKGARVAAFLPHADQVNESHLSVLRRDNGDVVAVRQIAGLVARRVVCYLKEGQSVTRGEHLGLIKFGSRVDLFVPLSYRVLVEPGARLAGGKTPVARPQNGAPPSPGPGR